VNWIDITVAPHDQAVALLTGIRGEISLVVSRDQTPTSHGAASPLTWPSATPLDAAHLPIIVQQPPTPGVVKDAADVARDSFSAPADVDIERAETTERPLIDLSDAPEPAADDVMTSRGRRRRRGPARRRRVCGED